MLLRQHSILNKQLYRNFKSNYTHSQIEFKIINLFKSKTYFQNKMSDCDIIIIL